MAARQWKVVNTSFYLDSNNTDDPLVPEGRIDPAGGVWDNLLWLSMGRNKNQRTLSDLWVLTVNETEDGEELTGETSPPLCSLSLSLSLSLTCLLAHSLTCSLNH